MATTNFKGNPVPLRGELPVVGSSAPGFRLTGSDLADMHLSSFNEKNLILNIFPSIDTPVCANSVRRFNELAAQRPDTKVLCISRDLPFAHSRFCAAEGLDNVVPLSLLRDPEFGSSWGLEIAEGPLAGLLARAVVVLDGDRRIRHVELVPDITLEPDYDAALRVSAP